MHSRQVIYIYIHKVWFLRHYFIIIAKREDALSLSLSVHIYGFVTLYTLFYFATKIPEISAWQCLHIVYAIGSGGMKPEDI